MSGALRCSRAALRNGAGAVHDEMTDFPEQSRLAGLLAGRWQIPAALLAIAIGGVALLNLSPKPPPKVELDAVLADVAQLESTGDVLGAATSLQRVMASDTRALDPEVKGGLHERLADLLYRNEARQAEHSKANLELILSNNRAAQALGRALSPDALAAQSLAEFWLGETETALPALVDALASDLKAETRDLVLKSLVEALESQHLERAAAHELLASLLEQPRLPEPFLWWAIQSAIEEAFQAADIPAARAIVDQHAALLTTSDLEGYGRYLDAAVAMAEGRVEDAYPGAWWVEAWIPHRPRVAEALDRFASLPALNRTLLGRAQLANNEPAAALSSFEYVLNLRPTPNVRTTALVGQASALAALGRHEAAREVLIEGVQTCKDDGPQHAAIRQAARDALLELQSAASTAGELDSAIAYLRSALELTPEEQTDTRRGLYESLARLAAEAAEKTDSPTAARSYHDTAGEALAAAAQTPEMAEALRADHLWGAAEHYDQAGNLAAALPLLEAFVSGRPSDPRAPAALLKLGQANEGLGRPAAALRWYELLIRAHDEIDLSAAARIRAARTLISLGNEHFAQAEERLVELISSGRVSPAAALYRDALLTLGELFEAEQRDAAAIARFEEFQRLYPNDERLPFVQIRLANAYRRSGTALQKSASAGPAGEAQRQEATARLAQAAEAYARVLAQTAAAHSEGDQAPSTDGDEHGRVRAAATDSDLARLAMLYRADCLYELGSPESLTSAFGLYQAAAMRLEGRAEALTAYVQMANIQLRQGDRAGAARSLDRARWLLDALPDSAFLRDPQAERSAWQRFFDTTRSSTLLRDVFAARPATDR